MDNHKVFCGFIIFLQIADLSRESAYNFSLCNHDEIREDLLNVLDGHMGLNEDGEIISYSPPPPATSLKVCAEAGTGRDGEQEPGRLLPERYLTLPGALQTPRTEKPLVHYRADGEDGFTVAKGLQLDFHTCEDTPERPEQSEERLRAQREGRLLQCVLDGARGCGGRGLWPSTLRVVQRNCRGYRPPQGWRRGTAAPREAVAGGGLCDEGKVRELLAVWRSYMNLA